MNLLEYLLNVFFPGICVICGKNNENYLCSKCFLKIKKELIFNMCMQNQNEVKLRNFRHFYLGKYKNSIRKLILKYKFSDCAYMSNAFTYLLLKNDFFLKSIKKYDCIIAIPMHKKAEEIRGFNQSKLIAKQIANKCEIEYLENTLIKYKENKRQSELNKEARVLNVKNVYKLINKASLENKKVLIFDDIYTTGSTIKECRKELLKANPLEVDCLTIAKR